MVEVHTMTMDEIKRGRELVDSIASSVWAKSKELSPHVPVMITETRQQVKAVLVRETMNQVLVDSANRRWMVNADDLSPDG